MDDDAEVTKGEALCSDQSEGKPTVSDLPSDSGGAKAETESLSELEPGGG